MPNERSIDSVVVMNSTLMSTWRGALSKSPMRVWSSWIASSVPWTTRLLSVGS